MEYKAYEEQLQTTLLDLKKREEQLAEEELEVRLIWHQMSWCTWVEWKYATLKYLKVHNLTVKIFKI